MNAGPEEPRADDDPSGELESPPGDDRLGRLLSSAQRSSAGRKTLTEDANRQKSARTGGSESGISDCCDAKVIRGLEDDRGELELVRVPVDVADRDDRDLELCYDHDQPKKRAEAERSPEGEPEAGESVRGTEGTTGGTENGKRKPAQRSEQDRRCGGGSGGGGCTVSCTCAKVTPRCCCVGSSEPEAVETGGES